MQTLSIDTSLQRTEISKTTTSTRCQALNSPTPPIIGLYGISDPGKPYLLDKLKSDTSLENLVFYAGSEMIDQVASGGLKVFTALVEDEKVQYRKLALAKVSKVKHSLYH
jgi:hypothetical protein